MLMHGQKSSEDRWLGMESASLGMKYPDVSEAVVSTGLEVKTS